jgi:uncharacterized membrane protein YGL010W
MATESEHAAPHDARRPVDRFLGSYSEDHRDPTNRAIHWVCVPLIVWTVVALLWVLPVPTVARPGLWAGLAGVAAVAFYLRLSRPLALAMALFFAALLALTGWLHARIGSAALAWSALALFVAAWVAQFVGHKLEGRRPSFLTDLAYLLIGPLWLMSKLFRRAGLHW